MRRTTLHLRDIAVVALFALAYSSTGMAQNDSVDTAAGAAVVQEPAGAIALPVAEGSSEASRSTERWVTYKGEARLRNVSQPTLTPFLPQADRATGAAVIIAPGGGFVQLAIDKEGWSVARWLADHGIAAFVLKYRLISLTSRPGRATTARPTVQEGETEQLRTYAPGAEDVREAIRLVRAQADNWGVDPNRVGAMGFSAGATLALSIATDPDPTLRPDFVVPVYAPVGKIAVPKDAPPMFTAIAADDGIFDEYGTGLMEAWYRAKRPVEFHLYETGGHGFGVPGVTGTTTTGMMEQLLRWLESRQLLNEETEH